MKNKTKSFTNENTRFFTALLFLFGFFIQEANAQDQKPAGKLCKLVCSAASNGSSVKKKNLVVKEKGKEVLEPSHAPQIVEESYTYHTSAGNPDSVFTNPTTMPAFMGGADARTKYISSHLKYPEMAKEMGIQGRVIVEFIVETDGRITSQKVVKSAHPMLDDEAMRVIKTMPNWEPATYNGSKVRARYSLPIKFQFK